MSRLIDILITTILLFHWVVACSQDVNPGVMDPTDSHMADTAGIAMDSGEGTTDTANAEDISAPLDSVMPDAVNTADTVDTGDQPPCDALSGPQVSITVNEIPDEMNGTHPFTNNAGELQEFRLLLPPWGFSMDLEWKSVDGSQPRVFLNTGTEMEITAWFPLSTGQTQVIVDQENALPLGSEIILRAEVVDSCGQVASDTITFHVAELTPQLHPFDLTDTWIIRFKRDQYTLNESIDAEGNVVVTGTEGADGVIDLLADLATLGLVSEQAPAASELILAWFAQ